MDWGGVWRRGAVKEEGCGEEGTLVREERCGEEGPQVRKEGR